MGRTRRGGQPWMKHTVLAASLVSGLGAVALAGEVSTIAVVPEKQSATVKVDPNVVQAQVAQPRQPDLPPATGSDSSSLPPAPPSSASPSSLLQASQSDQGSGPRAGPAAGPGNVSQGLNPERGGVVNNSAAAVATQGGSTAQFLNATDAGDLLARSNSTLGVEAQRRSPIANEARIRGYRLGQITTWADNAYWFPARNDLDTFLSKIDSGIIRDVIVQKGPYSARYGPGFSFIDIATYESPRYENGFDWNGRTISNYKDNGQQLYFRQVGLVGAEDWGARLSYGHRTGNDYTMGNGLEIPSSYNSRDIDFVFGQNISQNARFEIGYIRLDQTGLEFPGQVFDTTYLGTDGYRAKLIVENQQYFDRMDLTGYYNRTRFSGNAQSTGKRRQIPELDLIGFTGFTDGDVMNTGGQIMFTWGRQGEAQWMVGADFRMMSQNLNEFDNVFTEITECLFNFPIPRTELANIGGVFVEHINPLSDRLTIRTGGRLDYQTADAKGTPVGLCDGEPAAVLVGNPYQSLERNWMLGLAYVNTEYKATDNVTLLSGYGFAMRPPTPTELYAMNPFLASLQNGLTSVLGNPELDAEKLHQIDLGVRADYGFFRSGVNGYYSWIRDYITFQAIGDNQGKIPVPLQNALNVRFVNTSQARLFGGEAYAEVDVNSWLTPFVTYTLVKGDDLTRDGRTSPNVAASLGLPNPSQEPLPMIAPPEFRAGLRFHEPGQTPRYGLDVLSRMVMRQDRVAASLREQTTPGFTVWDLRGYWQATQGILLTGGVENLFDKFYREHLDLRTGLGVFQPGRTVYVGMELRY